VTYAWSTGATTSTISTSTAGTYSVTVTDTKGCTGSGTGSLTVNPNPTVSVDSVQACAGNSATITATPAGGTGSKTFAWSTGATTSTISVNTAGNYSVTVTDTKGCTASGFGKLTVNALPAISADPTNQTVTSGSSASFSVTATGAGLTYQWRKATVNLVNGGNISGATSATLTINPAAAADAGSYDVVVSGTCPPSKTSNPATLTVNRIPTTSSLTTAPNPSIFGQSVIFSDTVKGGATTGLVYFKVDGIVVDSAAINGSGIALVSKSNLAIGTHAILARYNGSASYDTSTSNTVSQVVKPDTFTIAASAGLHGTINPSGNVKAARGSNKSFSMVPSSGYHVDSVIVDGAKVDSTASYTFINVTANHTIRATFAQSTFTITASAGANGTITPSGAVVVNAGASQAFAITGNTGYRVLDVVVDGSSVGTATNYSFTNVSADHTISATFEVSPAYATMYRSFRADSIVASKDNKGKPNKYVARKPDKVDFLFVVRNDSVAITDFHVEFSIAIDTSRPFFTVPASTISNGDLGKMKKWNFTFASPLAPGDSVRVQAFGNKGKLQKVGKYWWTRSTVKNGPNHKNPFFVRNQPKLPMPNRINALAENFAFSGFMSTNGLLVGKDRTLDSAKQYGWLLSPKYTNVVKTLSDKTGPHTTAAHGFNVLVNGKPVLKRHTQLPPATFNDVLLADMIALKISIVASQLEKTPLGFGELIYNDGTANPLNGLMIKEIAHVGDSLMMGSYSGGIHVFADQAAFDTLDYTIKRINNAFEGPMDTVKFSDSLKLKGVRALADVPYLRSNSSAVPEKLQPVQVINLELPLSFELRQNYPNPFNPTTTIEFQLSDPAVVTLKVYNIVGQTVATLLENQQMEDGEQQVEFNASTLASGIYFYRIFVEQPANLEDGIPSNYHSTTRKMILVK
jgi:hypothetical protein